MHHIPQNIHVSWARGQNLGHLVFFFLESFVFEQQWRFQQGGRLRAHFHDLY